MKIPDEVLVDFNELKYIAVKKGYPEKTVTQIAFWILPCRVPGGWSFRKSFLITSAAVRLGPQAYRHVLAHEMGHLLSGHGIAATRLCAALLGVGAVTFVFFSLSNVPITSVFLGFFILTIIWILRSSKFKSAGEHEYEADAVAAELLIFP